MRLTESFLRRTAISVFTLLFIESKSSAVAIPYKLRVRSYESVERLKNYAKAEVVPKIRRKPRPAFRKATKDRLYEQQITPNKKHVICFICGQRVLIGPHAIHIDHFSDQWALRRDKKMRSPGFAKLTQKEKNKSLADLYNEPGLRLAHAQCNLHRTNFTGETVLRDQVQKAKKERDKLYLPDSQVAKKLSYPDLLPLDLSPLDLLPLDL